MFTSERQWKRDFPGHSWSLGRSFHRVHCGYDALYIKTPKNIKELRHMRMPYKPCFHCCQAATAMKAIFWPSSAKCAHFCDFPFVVGLLRHFREVYEGVKQRDLQATKMENELMFHHCHWNAQMYLRYSSYHHHVYIFIIQFPSGHEDWLNCSVERALAERLARRLRPKNGEAQLTTGCFNGETQRGTTTGKHNENNGEYQESSYKKWKMKRCKSKICIHKLFPNIGLKPSVIHFEEL